jgi:hypothetical protein
MLHCYWPEQLRNSDEGFAEIERNGFNMGVFLMAVGMGEITDKTIDELRFRGELLARLHGDEFYRKADLVLWKGLSINGSNEPRRTWLSRKKKGLVSSHVYGKPAKEQAAIKKQAEARFKLLVAQAEVATAGELPEVVHG